MSSLQTGAQLYTVRDYTQNEADFAETIRRIADMGYKTVQLSAIGAGLKPEWIRRTCDDAGLSIVLTHSDYNRILHDTDRLIEEHDILGAPYIGLGYMPPKYHNSAWLYRFYEEFKAPAAKMAEKGKLLMYHNHNFEFSRLCVDNAPDGKENKRIIEYLADWFAPEEMGFTLDTYWIQMAGCDVTQWIEKFSDRIPCVHLKDVVMRYDKPLMAPVMEGNINFASAFAALEKSSCRYMLVEQDVCETNPFDCLKKSYDNLAKAGYR